MLETGNFVKLIFEACLGVWHHLCQHSACSVCSDGLRCHKQINFMLDNKFRPEYNPYMEKDRLHRENNRLQNKPCIIF